MIFLDGFAATSEHARRPNTRDVPFLIAAAVLAFAAAHFFDLPLIVHHLGLQGPPWVLDDAIFLVFVLTSCVLIYGFRRYRELSREISARINAEHEAHNLARHDPLTGLPNRRYFEEQLNNCLGTVNAEHQLAVFMLDLDGFKVVNDTYGHAVGDTALIEFSARVLKVLRDRAFLARIGGDEFAVIAPQIGSPHDVTNLARRIAAAVTEPVCIGRVTVEFGVGIGIAVAPKDGIDPDELVRRADRALYRAKAAGRSSVRFFEEEMDFLVERRMQMERELQQAITSNQIVPHYQPLISLHNIK